MIAAAYAFDPEGYAGGENYTPACPLRGDSFMAQEPVGIRWLHVHPTYLVDEFSWQIVKAAREYEDGKMPFGGGFEEQPAWTMAAIEIVRRAWAKLRDARDRRLRPV